MNKEKFIETWETMDDEMRCRWLSKISEQKYIPEYKIEIDNDCVFLSFNDEVDYDDQTKLYFNNFGYYLLPYLFKAMGIKNADLV